MIENLSDILKYSLECPTHTVTLDQEIKNTMSYIAIQRVRYDNKFDVTWDYDVNVSDYKIIKLILQPFIENCIYHGIKEKKGKSGIKIKILQPEGVQRLKISIIDNGLGIPKESLLEIRRCLNTDTQNSGHIGLYNTNKRLKLSYGEQSGLKILSKAGRGTAIHICIPAEKDGFHLTG